MTEFSWSGSGPYCYLDLHLYWFVFGNVFMYRSPRVQYAVYFLLLLFVLFVHFQLWVSWKKQFGMGTITRYWSTTVRYVFAWENLVRMEFSTVCATDYWLDLNAWLFGFFMVLCLVVMSLHLREFFEGVLPVLYDIASFELRSTLRMLWILLCCITCFFKRLGECYGFFSFAYSLVFRFVILLCHW